LTNISSGTAWEQERQHLFNLMLARSNQTVIGGLYN
jgi:hypothetical protein